MSTATKTKPAAHKNRPIEKFQEIVRGGDVKVQREAGIISGVKVLGKESRNGRTYTEAAMRNALPMYEGAKVEIDHDRTGSDRPFEVGFGEIRNVTLKPDGLYGDLHYLKSHRLAESVCESAERFPHQFGMSHNATGRAEHRGGKTIVEEITAVESVDVVGRPATTKGLFESEQTTMKITLKEFVGKLTTQPAADIRKLFEDDYPQVEMEMPAEGGADAQIKMAFRSMVMAAFDDESLDSKATMKKIGDILKAQEKLAGKPDSGATSDTTDPSTDPAMAESVKKETDAMNAKILESLDKLDKRLAAQEARAAGELKLAKLTALAAECNADADAALLESLLPLDDAKAKTIIEALPKKAEPARRGERPIIESKHRGAAAPAVPSYAEATKGGFAAALR